MRIVIDGRPLEVEGRPTILDAARQAGISIPHLCDHPHLHPFGACRLCLVEIKGRRGFPPSCCLSVEEGMEVSTQTPALQKMRREILELILSEHPSACLVCSEKDTCQDLKSTIRKVSEVTGCVLCSNNGRCELQDVVQAVGLDTVRFPALYRDLDIRRDDPFFDRNYNLCILCGRCVRVCSEMRGASAIAFTWRGSRAIIGTAFDRPLAQAGCQFCGACVDVCPTGALAERASRPNVIPEKWAEAVCGICGSGCRLSLGVKGESVLTVVPSESGPANQGQACVRGRFLARELGAGPRRILRPHVRKEGLLAEASWDEALQAAVQALQGRTGPFVALVTSPQLGLEHLFLGYGLGLDVLKTTRITGSADLSGLWAFDAFRIKAGVDSPLNITRESIGQADVILVCGDHLEATQPMAWLQVFQAVGRGAKLILLNSEASAADRLAAASLIVRPGQYAAVLNALAAGILKTRSAQGRDKSAGFKELQTALADPSASPPNEPEISAEDLSRAAGLLGRAKSAVIFFGPGPARELGSAAMAALWNISLLTGARLVPTIPESNLRGEFTLRRSLGVPDCSLAETLEAARTGRVKALLLAGPAPKIDRAGLEVLIVLDSHWSPNADQADVVLPAATFFESEGTFINWEGRVQKSGAAVKPAGESRPDWLVWSQLAVRLGAAEWGLADIQAVRREMEKRVPAFKGMFEDHPQDVFLPEAKRRRASRFVPSAAKPLAPASDPDHPLELTLAYGLDSYRSFDFSREVKGLRAFRDAAWVLVHPRDAAAADVKDGQEVIVEAGGHSLPGRARLTESVRQGTIRATLTVSSGAGLGLWGRTPVPARIRKG